jgi:U3 small nucleolar RNA-associated protein 20
MSSDEELDFGPEPPRVRRHRFKTFAERIAEVRLKIVINPFCKGGSQHLVTHASSIPVFHSIPQVDVDVFRRLAPVRDVPQNGASTFLVEALNKWRELNSTEHFTAVASAVSPLCESLPQLVHHADQVQGQQEWGLVGHL